MRNKPRANGCCVPYTSIFGMFMSSMNTIILLPADLGPYCLNVFLSMFSMKLFLKSKAEVLEDMLIFKVKNFSLSSFAKLAYTVTVLAVPDSPQKQAGNLRFMIYSSNHEYLTVSTVGTRIEPNFLLAGGT